MWIRAMRIPSCFFTTLIFLILFVGVIYGEPYFQQQVDYYMDVTLLPESKKYRGTANIAYTNHSKQSLDTLWFHVYPNAYKTRNTAFARQRARHLKRHFHFAVEEDRGYLNILSVKSNEQNLNWRYKRDAIDLIKIVLPRPLTPNQSITLIIAFEGKFPCLFSRMGYFGRDYFAATQWYPKAAVYDADGWHSESYLDMGEFYGEYGDFEVNLTVPRNYLVEATGKLKLTQSEKRFREEIKAQTDSALAYQSADSLNAYLWHWILKRNKQTKYSDTKTLTFKAENVHDFAWFAGDLFFLMEDTYRNAAYIANDSAITRVLVTPYHLEAWRNVPTYINRTLDFYGKHVGPYDYPKVAVVDGALSAGSGMEYPMVTIVSTGNSSVFRALEMVVMHEIGHNWFYGMLGSNERTCVFLDEGLNSFYEYKYMNHHYGRNNLTNFRNLFGGLPLLKDIGEWHLIHFSYGSLANRRLDQPLHLRADAFTPANYGAVNYHKSISLLLALEWYIGEETFQHGIRLYFDRWKGKHPKLKDFVQCMEEISGVSLQGFMQEWFYSTRYSDFEINRWQSNKKNNGNYQTEVYITNNGTMQEMPAPVTLTTMQGDTLRKRWHASSERPITFEHPHAVDFIEVNRQRTIFESNYLNNRTGLPEIKFNFIGEIPRFDTYPINIYPYYWYEYFLDKNRLGAGFWSGNPVFNQYFASGAFYYATASQKTGYKLTVGHRYRPVWSKYSDGSIHIRDMNGLRHYNLTVKNFWQSVTDNRSDVQLKLGIHYVNLHDERYNNPDMFEQHRYCTADLELEYRRKRMLHRFATTLRYEKALPVGDLRHAFARLSLTSNYRYYFQKDSYFGTRFYLGGLTGNGYPKQKAIYAAGDVDADHQRFTPARRGTMAPLNLYLLEGGLNMAGYGDARQRFYSGKIGASARVLLKYQFAPALYISAGTLAPDYSHFGAHVFTEVGLFKKVGFVELVVPFYISEPTSDVTRWGLRFNIRLSSGLEGFEFRF